MTDYTSTQSDVCKHGVPQTKMTHQVQCFIVGQETAGDSGSEAVVRICKPFFSVCKMLAYCAATHSGLKSISLSVRQLRVCAQWSAQVGHASSIARVRAVP